MLFENIEDENKKDQKLNSLERSIIFGLVTIAKVILWKVRRAKTYGDIMRLGIFIENKIDFLENKYPEKEIETEADINIALNEIDEAKKELEEL